MKLNFNDIFFFFLHLFLSPPTPRSDARFGGERESERAQPEMRREAASGQALLLPPPLGEKCRLRRGERPAPSRVSLSLMILPQVHLRKPCYDFYFL